jgi:ATP-dependent helicase YprA (DUF1998 family)
MTKTLHGVAHELQRSLREYIEATYHIGDPSLLAQRREALNEPGVIHQIPFLESTPRYLTDRPFAQLGLHPAALKALLTLVPKNERGKQVLYDPPYMHQAQALEYGFSDKKNLVIMTGTGSGKTESFLMPVLSSLAAEAADRPYSFSTPAVRAMVLYPMNALVNDQLGRLRAMFGDARVGTLFQEWAGRPPRFARYTSRTPYAGLRQKEKDSRHLKQFGNFYVDALKEAANGNGPKQQAAIQLIDDLKTRGKWPSKPDLEKWFGAGAWKTPSDVYRRAVTLPADSELLTRHEVQESPPDLLVTNYSMLEYMLMRPVERDIFDKTAAWLKASPEARFTLILDEAHLYRGAGGTEVALLLRRLRDRLDVGPEKFQVVCATASFNDQDHAIQFASELTGMAVDTFAPPIRGELALKSGARVGDAEEAAVLAAVDLDLLHCDVPAARADAVRPLLEVMGGDTMELVPAALHAVLSNFGPLALLVNLTMKQARPVRELPSQIFPSSSPDVAARALAALTALATLAKENDEAANLLPSRIHSFFRGLQGLWVCMDAQCKGLAGAGNQIAGRLYTQPRDRCESCSALVLELYTCRLCGAAYGRSYTPNPADPHAIWPEPGSRITLESGVVQPLKPLDILIGTPRNADAGVPITLDLLTGEIDALRPTARTRRAYLAPRKKVKRSDDDNDNEALVPGIFTSCGACTRSSSTSDSPVQDHETKGDQPMQMLVARQLQLQPPGHQKATPLAPLRGRKVLIFSDSRQVAARLAPSLQLYSARDAIRVAIVVGWKALSRTSDELTLQDMFAAALVGAHSLGVRLRPELHGSESFGVNERIGTMIEQGALNRADGAAQLIREAGRADAPRALLADIVHAIRDRLVGLEALATASLAESPEVRERLDALPDLTGMTTGPDERRQVVRAWLREWRRQGFHLRGAPSEWTQVGAPRGLSIKTRGAGFQTFVARLPSPAAKREFKRDWLPMLLNTFCDPVHGEFQLQGSRLSLEFDGHWVRCQICKTPQRPVAGLSDCSECGSEELITFDPDRDHYFIGRKGFYRRPIIDALNDQTNAPWALIAAEHTAQLNAAQHEEVFSKGERNELLFQDVALPEGEFGTPRPAIDVLSCTTTMEVGIDIGQLSGVALRNMPPARANYQQRAGRAGRRGSAVASVLAYSGSDTHDEHFFSHPADMITGPVVDPKLSLDNPDIARRHIRAFLLQAYLQARVLTPDPASAQLFSVLGSVREFLAIGSPLNRQDLAIFLRKNADALTRRVDVILPDKLSPQDRSKLLSGMIVDLLDALDDALQSLASTVLTSTTATASVTATTAMATEDAVPTEVQAETAETGSVGMTDPGGSLLDRLLYKGVLPRYAFPTDVATFHVFKRGSRSAYRAEFDYLPSQGMLAALSQYAPGKQVWIDGRLYSSRALYSRIPDDLFNRWQTRRVHAECNRCGYCMLEEQAHGLKPGEILDCPACQGEQSLGPAKWWLRPAGFAHPVDVSPTVTPEEAPETSYATRAKLTLESRKVSGWQDVNERIRTVTARPHLLVTNTGPEGDGYHYCLKCGRIESVSDPQMTLQNQHLKPYPDERQPTCPGMTSKVVLGTDFISDVALLSFILGDGVTLAPITSLTEVAMRTMAEAVSRAATDLLQIEHGEVVSEYRAAVTEAGVLGHEVEMFIFDTLPGGAGFSQNAVEEPLTLLQHAREIMATCPGQCQSSCYRCLRSFRNRLDHSLLDRHIGVSLIDYLLTGTASAFDPKRLWAAAEVMVDELSRHYNAEYTFGLVRESCGHILAVGKQGTLHIEIGNPLQLPEGVREQSSSEERTLIVSELLVRRHLARASEEIRRWLA